MNELPSAGDLHARTVPLDYGPDPLQFDGSPTVLFDRPGLTLVGWGTAVLVPAGGGNGASADAGAGAGAATDILAAIPCDDLVGRAGTGVLALGALPFDDAMAGQLIVPRFTMGIGRDADGETHRWATAVGPRDTPLPTTEELFESVLWQYGVAPVAPESSDVGIEELETPLPLAAYAAMVQRAVDIMRAPGADLRKVVLSRTITARLSGPLPLSTVLRRLRAHEPNCTIFSAPVPDGTFFGASPELLVARAGDRVTCHPLAGTIARGDTARADAEAQGRLAGSAKDQAEHSYVVDDIVAVLAPWCDPLKVPAAPSLVTFRDVAHLGTRIEGHLKEPIPVLRLLERLHPTAAVGGTPRSVALRTAATLEPVPRGYWAGPVGWADARGDGEWMIGIRSASVDPDGQSVTLHAGGGVVADSEPEAEAMETRIKLASVLESVVPGGSVHLR